MNDSVLVDLRSRYWQMPCIRRRRKGVHCMKTTTHRWSCANEKDRISSTACRKAWRGRELGWLVGGREGGWEEGGRREGGGREEGGRREEGREGEFLPAASACCAAEASESVGQSSDIVAPPPSPLPLHHLPWVLPW